MCMSPIKIKCPNSDLGIFADWNKFIEIPCGKCDDCRCTRAREWGVRCVCELISLPKEVQKHSYFITLTYDELHNHGVLWPNDVSKFIKKLRNKFRKKHIKYFYCGEYGSKNFRPHYHMIIYDLPLDDLVRVQDSKSGAAQFQSATIAELWPYGLHVLGEITLASAGYTARYALKKNSTDCYQRMSQGIGKKYFFDNLDEIVSNGYVLVPNSVGGVSRAGIPRYFLKLYRKYLDNDKKYSKFIKWYIKKKTDYLENSASGYKEFEPFNLIQRKTLGIKSASVKRKLIAMHELNQSLMTYYHDREFGI